MAPGTKEEELIRDYLLGEVSEEERESLEKRLLSDRDLSDLARVIESILVEDYLDGTLREQARERFEKLLLATPQGAEQMRFALTLKDYASRVALPRVRIERREGPFQSMFRSPRWALAAAAAVLLIASGIGLWRAFFFESEISKGLKALSKAYPERSVDARITGLAHAPRIQLRGAEERVDQERLRQAELILKGEARDAPGPESFHALGRLYLAKRDFQQAIDYLNRALALDPDDALIYSDLGAAYLELGKFNQGRSPGDEPEEFDRSRDRLARALELKPGLLDALFNLALLEEEEGSPAEAAVAWQEYLRRDPASPWADEARSRLKAIENK